MKLIQKFENFDLIIHNFKMWYLNISFRSPYKQIANLDNVLLENVKLESDMIF